MVRIIIAGGRDFTDYNLLKESVINILLDLECRNIIDEVHLIEFISGTAKGADQLGEKLINGSIYKSNLKRFPADWDRYGKSAGYIRNEQMAKYAMSDGSCGVLIAFWDGKSRGTKHMIDLANKYGLEVHIINY